MIFPDLSTHFQTIPSHHFSPGIVSKGFDSVPLRFKMQFLVFALRLRVGCSFLKVFRFVIYSELNLIHGWVLALCTGLLVKGRFFRILLGIFGGVRIRSCTLKFIFLDLNILNLVFQFPFNLISLLFLPILKFLKHFAQVFSTLLQARFSVFPDLLTSSNFLFYILKVRGSTFQKPCICVFALLGVVLTICSRIFAFPVLLLPIYSPFNILINLLLIFHL